MLTLNTKTVFALAVLLRVVFFFYGLYQDEYLPVKYTDIDYLVFSDASKYVYYGLSPYKRETYRYTPLLSWMLIPNAWGGVWYHFGKVLFMVCDLITGWIITRLLQNIHIKGAPLSSNRVSILSSLWLLNPMVITISTRGSSESVLTVMIMASLYFLIVKKSITTSALLLGLSIHFKIYPIIYLSSIMYYLANGAHIINLPVIRWINVTNLKYLIVTCLSVSALNWLMYKIYDFEFMYHSYLYHLTRLDHRHNFSIYNIALYYKSALTENTQNIENFAFIPQIMLSAVLIPLVFADRDLISSLFLQTFAFVTFNKVMTSQYFLWFLIFLPHYLSRSRYLTRQYMWRGVVMVLAWVISQAAWLGCAYNLEFLGINAFSELLYASIGFFLVNCWLLAQFFQDLS
ncbi:glycosyltransferase family 50 protein [Suhomyces tanzawaensis NRRL Y-17324]|uniref:GPI mannosyltransferase 1 n=1 Tax=Suhomyces tanzawaensis NRRL Y-17324 TaxID=984487 RepID=A0A1E4SLX3_9ASCO|nr:glycosyltransferase family 50 protein [Suhomyces tanzawaensis NRRL Y-17324]ODV80495.1 glycosyltransferase family 50 protein [Suhomyces tanzawaensis NRRL Y-17324]